jgi:signal transduction histidine kinase/ActR/RegA family two-component response regulator
MTRVLRQRPGWRERSGTGSRQLGAVFESAAIGIAVVDRYGAIVDCNEAYADLVGRPRDELVGADAEALAVPARGDGEQRHVRPDGEVVWARVTSSPVDGGEGLVLAVVEDVTDRRRAERRLREQTELLERAQELARLGSFELELPEGKVIASHGLADRLGIDPRFFTAPPAQALRLVHPDDRPAVERAYRAAVEDGEKIQLSFRMQRLDGSTVWLLADAVRETAPSGAHRLVGVLQDVTERHVLEERLLRAEKLEAVGQLAGGLTHDFANLLTVIGGNAQLALRDLGSEKGGRYLHEIVVAAQRASELTRSLLDFSRAGSDHPSLLDLNELVADAQRTLRRVIQDRVEIIAEPCAEPALVLADRARLEQVLLNLAFNARDAMPDGGRVSIRVSTWPQCVVLEVADNGDGMEEAVRERIFEPFFTTKPTGRGTGLGLSSVYGTVTQAGGSIEVESEPGLGTTFTIFLPRSVAGAGEPAPEEAFEFELPAGPGGARVLVVEDEPQLRVLTAEALEQAGFTVAIAARPNDALRILDREEEPFDALLSDVELPAMDGHAFLDELEARGHRMPVVFASGFHDEAEARALDGSRQVAFLHKPFSPLEVVAALRTLLDDGSVAA